MIDVEVGDIIRRISNGKYYVVTDRSDKDITVLNIQSMIRWSNWHISLLSTRFETVTTIFRE